MSNIAPQAQERPRSLDRRTVLLQRLSMDSHRVLDDGLDSRLDWFGASLTVLLSDLDP